MKLTDPNLKIVTVHASTTVRQLINTELRAKGFQDVVGAPDLQTVLGILETGLIHWLITPVISDDKANVFQILKLVTEDPSLMDMRVSFVVEETVDPLVLSKSFDLGLLSFHKKMGSKADIEEELRELFERNARFEGIQCLLAASYLRQVLGESKRYTDLLRFEKSLFHRYAGHLQLISSLTEAHLLNGQVDVARQLVAQGLLVKPELKADFDALLAKYKVGETAAPAPSEVGPLPDMLGISRCLLLEPDDALRELISSLLKQLGIRDVQAFAEGTSALEWLKSGNKPELILFEWRLPIVPGPIFVQRLRESVGYDVPVTVMNQDLSDRDMPVLREMGVTNRIKKPIEPQAFLRDVLWVIHQDRTPSEPVVILQKLRQSMIDHDRERLAAYTKRYMDSEKVGEAEKMTLQAELAYFRGHYANAKALALKALRIGPASVEILNLLGKAMMKMRDFESALRCLENAEVVSPQNVRRVCNMAESHLELGNEQTYEQKVTEAREIAPDSQPLQELETKAALVRGDSKKATDLMRSLQSLLNIVSFTNNRAISLTRCDRFEDGIKLYKEAVQAVPSDKKDVQAILYYNLGLAFSRNNQLQEALGAIEKAAEAKNQKIHFKVQSLKARLHKAIAGHEPLSLYVAPPPQTTATGGETDPQKDMEELMMALTVSPGDIACHKLFVERQVGQGLREQIERPLRFKKRSTIQRSTAKSAS
jgi:tetratricopeptide (TPR) repeat protein